MSIAHKIKKKIVTMEENKVRKVWKYKIEANNKKVQNSKIEKFVSAK